MPLIDSLTTALVSERRQNERRNSHLPFQAQRQERLTTEQVLQVRFLPEIEFSVWGVFMGQSNTCGIDICGREEKEAGVRRGRRQATASTNPFGTFGARMPFQMSWTLYPTSINYWL